MMLRFFELIKNINKSFDYKMFWHHRYEIGGDSGAGSYGVLGEYKAKVVNEFINTNNIRTVVEFGCGDGNVLKMIECENYLGFDVAPSAIERCKGLFYSYANKSFSLYNPKMFFNNGFILADLVICLDVLYHITDENDFLKTLEDIFSCSSRYVILYTSLNPYISEPNSHVFHRDIIPYLSKFEHFKISEVIYQRYPEQSSADFVFLEKI